MDASSGEVSFDFGDVVRAFKVSDQGQMEFRLEVNLPEGLTFSACLPVHSKVVFLKSPYSKAFKIKV